MFVFAFSQCFCALSVGRDWAAQASACVFLVLARSEGTQAKQDAEKPFVRHSERSEKSLLIQTKGLREILRAKSALRMMMYGIFPQPVKRVPQANSL
jgi:hypothetical protein